MSERDLEPVDVDEAYRTLHVLPSAPRALADEVHRALRNTRLLAQESDGSQLVDELDRLDRAHDTIARDEPELEHEVPALNSPWALLHIACDAPPEVVELAYRFWQRERGLSESDFARPAEPQPPAVEPVGQGEPAQTQERPNEDPPAGITSPAPSNGPVRLVAETGTAHPAGVTISESPLRIGGDPTCDIVVGAAGQKRGRTEARLWRRDGRVLFHGVAGDTSVNGHPVGWAVLDPGDVVRVGEATFRCEASY